VETLLAEYHLTLSQVFRLSFPAGLALLEARSARLYPGQGLGYIDRAIIHARNATAARLLRSHRLV
jgi:hypothetical protein